jgi:ABC-type polysaccharide/polyol phosphate export permease
MPASADPVGRTEAVLRPARTIAPSTAQTTAGRRVVPKRTIIGDLRTVVREVLERRDLVRQFVLRDIRVRYKQAVFGFAWALLVPCMIIVAGLAVRIAIAHAAGLSLTTNQVAGMAVKSVPWAFFVGCIGAGTLCLTANLALVTKVYFPRLVLPLSSVLAQSFDSLIGLALLTVVLPVLGVTPSWQLLWVPLLLVLLWTLALTLAVFLSCANLFFRDVKYLVQVFLTFGIFVTPVLVEAGMFGKRIAPIVMLNPVAPILEGLRLSVVVHHNLLENYTGSKGFVVWQPWYLAYVAAWAFGGLVLSVIMFHRSERRFAELV